MNQSNLNDLSSEKEDIVRFVATEATTVALTTREIERESELDPELQSVRYYIDKGDWSKCKLMHIRVSRTKYVKLVFLDAFPFDLTLPLLVYRRN